MINLNSKFVADFQQQEKELKRLHSELDRFANLKNTVSVDDLTAVQGELTTAQMELTNVRSKLKAIEEKQSNVDNALASSEAKVLLQKQTINDLNETVLSLKADVLKHKGSAAKIEIERDALRQKLNKNSEQILEQQHHSEIPLMPDQNNPHIVHGSGGETSNLEQKMFTLNAMCERLAEEKKELERKLKQCKQDLLSIKYPAN